jgi:hypothetical protein
VTEDEFNAALDDLIAEARDSLPLGIVISVLEVDLLALRDEEGAA